MPVAQSKTPARGRHRGLAKTASKFTPAKRSTAAQFKAIKSPRRTAAAGNTNHVNASRAGGVLLSAEEALRSSASASRLAVAGEQTSTQQTFHYSHHNHQYQPPATTKKPHQKRSNLNEENEASARTPAAASLQLDSTFDSSHSDDHPSSFQITSLSASLPRIHGHQPFPTHSEDGDDETTHGSLSVGMRLDFASASTSPMPQNNTEVRRITYLDESVPQKLSHLRDNHDNISIYRTRQRANSNASSSHGSSQILQKNSSGGYEDLLTASTGGTTPSRSAASYPSGEHHHLLPATPQEVKVNFPKEMLQCSPIPGIPEEGVEQSGASWSPPNQKMPAASHHDSTALNSSNATTPTSPRRARYRDESFAADPSNDSTLSSLPPSPRLVCPPTPIRTPAWVNGKSRHSYPRSNSLITTKLLASSHDHSGDGPEELHEENPSDVEGPSISMITSFDIISMLGSGSFANVYKVRAKQDSQLYAVKKSRRIFRSKRDRQRALDEVRFLQRLQMDECASRSLHLITFHQAWQEDGFFFVQTELCCRDTCENLILSLRREWPVSSLYLPCVNRLPPSSPLSGDELKGLQGRLLPESTILKIAHDIASALSHVHACHLTHNDVKPSNIFFARDPMRGVVCKLGDFGCAGEVGSSQDGQEGDSKYMSPECLSLDRREPSSDIFSLGLTLFECAADISFQVPADGIDWHYLRSGKAVELLPPCRKLDLRSLLSSMISPSFEKRPNAASIVSCSLVRGLARQKDAFLCEYVHDVSELECREESAEVVMQGANDDVTPRMATRKLLHPPGLDFAQAPAPPNLFSPGSRPSH